MQNCVLSAIQSQLKKLFSLMEGFCWNGIGERNPKDPLARKHRVIEVGGLFAQEVGDNVSRVLDVVVAENHAHWQAWRAGEPFDVDAFLAKTVYYQQVGETGSIADGKSYPHPSVQENVDAIAAWMYVDHMSGSVSCKLEDAYAHTLTSDYVSRINVLQLVAAVNNLWKWHTVPDAITQVVVPHRDLERGTFHPVKQVDVATFTIARDWEEIQNRKKARK